VGLNKLANGTFESSVAAAFPSCPADWDLVNYAECHSEYFPVFENRQDRRISWSMDPVKADYGGCFCVLSTGDVTLDKDTSYSEISQAVSLAPGDILTGDWFFGTGDYLGWNDYASVMLMPADPNGPLEAIEVLHVDVADVGDYSSTDGWQKFALSFDEESSGNYLLTCGVYDRNDTIFKSYLMLDNLYAGEYIPRGDFNGDCRIDLLDLGTFADIYGTDCNQPAADCTYTDCAGRVLHMDDNGNLIIDIQDVAETVIFWLWGKP
jgi:hypothetical protein